MAFSGGVIFRFRSYGKVAVRNGMLESSFMANKRSSSRAYPVKADTHYM